MARFSEPVPFFLDPATGAETARLVDLHQWLLRAEGDLFPEEPAICTMHTILDIACGPGAWALDVARTYPHVRVTGIDNAHGVIDYARAYAGVHHLPNVSFRVMDMLEPLDFPDHFFDMINIRSIFGYLPKTAWVPLFQECLRITRPGGMLRLNEAEWSVTTSRSLQQIGCHLSQALTRAGRSFAPDDGQWTITPLLPTLLRKAGYGAVDHIAHAADFSMGTPGHQCGFDDLMAYCKLVQPFVCHWSDITHREFEHLYQQSLAEMLVDDFCGMRSSVTAWGYKRTCYSQSG